MPLRCIRSKAALHNGLTIDNCRLAAEVDSGADDRGIAVAPIVSLAGKHTRLPQAATTLGRACETGKPARCSRAGPTSYRADEEVPRVPDSKARQKWLARQYSGHDALPADCKFPWQPKMGRLRLQRSWSSDPPIWRGTRPSDSTTRVQAYSMLPLKMLRVLPVEHRTARHLLRGKYGGSPSLPSL